MGRSNRTTNPDFPREAYMGPRQLAYFHAKLTAWRKALLSRQRLSLAELGENDERAADPIDQGVAETSRQQELDRRLRSRRLLQQIDAALVRISDGSYGYCLESGEEIGLERLEALPIATLCVEMQEQRERRTRSRRLDLGNG